MIWLAVVLLVGGLLLSALFSGSETGFYRMGRVRLVLDGLGGDRIAQGLLWLTNRPSLFIATTLIGNNVANYCVSLSLVLATTALFTASAHVWELALPLLFSPLLFVFGELVPKNLYFQAPNRLLRLSGPPLLAAFVIFLIPSLVLWAISRVVEWIAGQSPQQVKLALTRKELEWALDEGWEAGILRPAQRQIAEGLFGLASQPISRFATPAGRLARVRLGMSRAEVLRLARRHRTDVLPVEEPLGRRRLIGYVRVADLHLDEEIADADSPVTKVRPLTTIPAGETFISAIMLLFSQSERIAGVVDENGHTTGVVTTRRLSEAVFRHVT